MWKEAQVAERMSPVSAADVGTVAVITVSGLIGPERSLTSLPDATAWPLQSRHPRADRSWGDAPSRIFPQAGDMVYIFQLRASG